MKKLGAKIREGLTVKGAAVVHQAKGLKERDCSASGPADPGRRACLIAETAYFLALERHFVPGRELDDWLQAEQEVDATLHSSAEAGSAERARQESGDGNE